MLCLPHIFFNLTGLLFKYYILWFCFYGFFCAQEPVCLCIYMCFFIFLDSFLKNACLSCLILIALLLFYLIFLDACMFSNEIERKKVCEFVWMGRWRGSGRNCCNQNILFEKNLIKDRLLISQHISMVIISLTRVEIVHTSPLHA